MNASPCSLPELQRWFATKGGTIQPVALGSFSLPQLPSHQERGLQTLEAISKGGLALTIPTQAFMGTRAALDKERSSVANALASHPHLFGSASSTLALFLMSELSLANESFFAPYLRCLPRAGETVGSEEAEVSTVLWGSSQLDMLQASPLAPT